MDRDQFCAILETEYSEVNEQWFQTTQLFGPPATVWNWLHNVRSVVQDHHQRIIHYLIAIYKRKFQLLTTRLGQLSAREDQLQRAISQLFA